MFELLKRIYYLWGILINCDNLLFKGVEWTYPIEIRGRLHIRNKGMIQLGKFVRVNSSIYPNPIGGGVKTQFQILKNASLKIGEGTKITNAAVTSASSVEIGKYVFIGSGVGIFDTNFHSLNAKQRVNRRSVNEKINSSPIKIGDFCFIGTRSLILKGVKIGDNSVIGAGSVVTSNVPSNEIWAGNPAVKIRDLRQEEIC